MDVLPFSRALDLFEHWEDNPTVRVAIQMLLNVYTDWEPRRRSSSPEESMQNVMAMGGSTQPIEALPEWLRASMTAWENQTQGKPN